MLLFYLRVFINKGLRIATKVAIGIVSAWTLANILANFLACLPFGARWQMDVLEKCPDVTKTFVAIGIYNILSDFVILGMPIPTIWTLKTGWHFKVAITGILALGLL